MLIVAKAGGNVVKSDLSEIAKDAKEIADGGSSLVFVHGGGAEVTLIAEKLG